MIRTFFALVGRALGTAASSRMLLAAGVVTLLLLSLVSVSIVMDCASVAGDPDLQAARIRSTWASASMMSFSFFLAVMAATLGAGLLASDLRKGTLFGVLARPVSRSLVFVATWAAGAAVLLVLEAVRSGFLLGFSSVLAGSVDSKHVLGILAVLAGHLLWVAIFAALSAALNPTYAILGGIVTYFVATFAYGGEVRGAGRYLVNCVGAVIPLAPGQTRVVLEALTGQAKDGGQVAEIVVYRLAWALLVVALGAWSFSRRDLVPRS